MEIAPYNIIIHLQWHRSHSQQDIRNDHRDDEIMNLPSDVSREVDGKKQNGVGDKRDEHHQAYTHLKFLKTRKLRISNKPAICIQYFD